MARSARNLAPADEQERPSGQVVKAKPVPGQMLDRSKAYGTVHGVGGLGHPAVGGYSQPDRFGVERFFDHRGRRMKIAGELPDGARAEVDPPPRRTGRATLPPEEAPERDEDDEEETGGPVVVDDVNLTAWVLKQETYGWAAVRRAIEKRYARVVSSEADAVEFLIAQGAVTPDMMRAAGLPLITDV